MKVFRLLLLVSAIFFGTLADYAQNDVLIKQFCGERSKVGEATIKNCKKYPKNGYGCTEFEISVPKAGNYYVNFWMIPTQEPTGNPSNYDVEVNGKSIQEKVAPTKCDWHSVALSHTVYLSVGTNTIALLGKLPFLPEVETLKLSSKKGGASISSELYDTYKQNIISGSIGQQSQDNPSSPGNRTSYPLYGLSWLGQQIFYTFTTTLYLQSGTTYNFKSVSNGSYQHYLELDTSPAANCVRVLSTNGQASTTVSSYGYYTIRARSSQHGVTGTINLSVNGTTQYSYVPIWNYERAYTQLSDKEYNSFLCYRSDYGDPYLDLMSYSSNSIYLARNDNGSSYGGDFNWGYCPRIKTQLSVSTDAALIFNNSSSYPSCTVDVYLGFPNVSDLNASILTSFPNYKDGDAIASAPASSNYNCFAWAGGDWENVIVNPNFPPYVNNNDSLSAWFNSYYNSRGYTKNGATVYNSIIDLWAKNSRITHASIRKNTDSDQIVHGYNWESKISSYLRVYHPRYALVNDYYGNVTEYYIKNPSSNMSNSVFEDVAEGRLVIENAQFTDSEISYINQIISSLDDIEVSLFYAKYQEWKNAIKESFYSSPQQLTDNDAYKALHNLCINSKDMRFLTMKLFEEKDQMAQILFYNLWYDYKELYDQVVEDNRKNSTKDGIPIYRSSFTTAVKFAKQILDNYSNKTDGVKNSSRKRETITYSDKNAFSVKSVNKTIDVMFSLVEDATLSVLVYTLDGIIVDQPLNNKPLSAGSHLVSSVISKSGTYLVVFKENGTTSVKKVFIN